MASANSPEVVVYTTPTCPWCGRTKAWLSQHGLSFIEKDVSRDRAAAEEMVRRSGQMGVPVTAFDGQIVVGFDQPRLERLLSAATAQVRLGATVASDPGGGVRVGQVHPGSRAAAAGLQPGDVIVAINGQPIGTVDEFQRRWRTLASLAGRLRLSVRRDGAERSVEIPLT